MPRFIAKAIFTMILITQIGFACAQDMLSSGSINGISIKAPEYVVPKVSVSPAEDTFCHNNGTQKRKTRTGAFLRSSVLPGWGQIYTGNKRMGKVYLIAASAASCFASYAVYKHHSNIHELNKSIDEYNDADNLEEAIAAYDIVEDKYDKAQSSNVLSRMSILTLSMIWSLNSIDALLFFSDDIDLKVGLDDIKGDGIKTRIMITYNI